MKINSLSLKNIGPFINAEIDFTNNSNKNPVTIITGENGTGKSIIIDAIRAILSGWMQIVASGVTIFAVFEL